MATARRAIQPHCDVCLRTPWYALPAEDETQYLLHESLGALEHSAKTCRMCKLVLKTALSRDQVLCGLRYDRGFWTLRSFRQCITEIGGIPREVMFMTLFGAQMPARQPNYSDVDSEYVVLGTFGHGMPENVFGSDFTRSLGGGRSVLAATAVTDDFRGHVPDARPYDEDVVVSKPPRNDMKVFVYSNGWASGSERRGKGALPDTLVGIGARIGTEPHILLETFNSKENQLILCGSGIGVCCDNEKYFPYVPTRLRAESSGSNEAFKQVSKWLAECQTSHDHCKPPPLNPQLPTRVLDVLTSQRRVQLVESKGSHGRYIALSHSWGSSPRITATKRTVGDILSGIAISFLPRTFQDAVAITRYLGIRYLWVDCLCIIQDDHDDWKREAAVMGEVYRDAYLTVSASSSRDSSSGCFSRRNIGSYISPATTSLGYDQPRIITEDAACCISYFNMPSTSGETMTPIASLRFFEEWLPGSASNAPQRLEIGRFGKDFDPIAASHLSTRGWTLQERLLSHRTIHYAEDQLYYECESGMWSEDGYSFPTPKFDFESMILRERIPFEQHGKREGWSSFAPDAEKPQTPIRAEGGWLSMVIDYSRRNLTKPEDKLTALAGVARLAAQRTSDRYYAGVWASHIYEDLCWRVQRFEESVVPAMVGRSMRSQPVAGPALAKASRPDEYRAPSWSWASLDGPVKFEALSYNTLVARVRKCTVKPSGADPYGRVESGQIDIEAPLFEVFPYNKPSSLVKHGTAVYIDLDDDRRKCIGTAYIDVGTTPEIRYRCYAMFIDPSNAILVRSTGRVSDIIARSIAPPKDGYKEREHLLDTIEARRLIKEDPRMKDQIMKPNFDVERIGLAVFTKGITKMGDDGFCVDDTMLAEQRAQSAEEDSDEELLKLNDLNIDDISIVKGEDSWGPVTKDDVRVWLTVV